MFVWAWSLWVLGTLYIVGLMYFGLACPLSLLQYGVAGQGGTSHVAVSYWIGTHRLTLSSFSSTLGFDIVLFCICDVEGAFCNCWFWLLYGLYAISTIEDT
jgi:hypothetical protein